MKKIILASVIGLALSTSAMATETGFYVGGALGDSQLSSNNSQIDLGPGYPFSKNSSAFAYELYGGYQFHPNFAVEAEWIDLGKQTIRFQNIDRTNEMTLRGLNIALVGNYEVYKNVNLFAKVGASYMRNNSYEHGAGFTAMEGTPDANNTDWSWRPSFGFGATYNFNKNLAVRAEWQYFSAKAGEHTVDMHSNVFTVGAQYKF